MKYIDILIRGSFYCQIPTPPNEYSVATLRGYIKSKLPTLAKEKKYDWSFALTDKRIRK